MDTSWKSKPYYCVLLSFLLLTTTGCDLFDENLTAVDTTPPIINIVGDNPQQVEVATDYIELGATAIDDIDGNISDSLIIDTSEVNTATITRFNIIYHVSDLAGNSTSQTRQVNVVDTTEPVITIVGNNPVTIEVNSVYSDQGATALDNLDGNITDSISTNTDVVDTSLLGSYEVSYSVVDTSGNSSVAIRNVAVIDSVIPVITLLGSNPQSLKLNEQYIELGAMATDNFDGDISDNIDIDVSAIDITILGSYQVTYNVMDSSNNSASTINRTVNVESTPSFIGITLNDTGLVVCTDGTDASLDCPVDGYLGQDAEYGRDAKAETGTLVKIGGGNSGFDFTKLDSSGNALPVSATNWACVEDNHTGIIWEVKTNDGGLHDASNTYSWYNPDSETNGGEIGIQNGGTCTESDCDTYAYVNAVNANGLCGASDWRLPIVDTLLSIADYSIVFPGPTIDLHYFPTTSATKTYWSKYPNALELDKALGVLFSEGKDVIQPKSYNNVIRLVRGGQ